MQEYKVPLVGDETSISVALVTRNQPESLRWTLRSLRAQSIQPSEVVVSNDSDPTDVGGVPDACDEFGRRYLTGPRRALYANLNNAMAHSLGPHIRTMDDDHEFPAGHIESCLIGELTPQHIREGADASQVERPPEVHPRGFSVAPYCSRKTWGVADGATIYPRHIFNRGDHMAELYVFGAAYLESGSRLYGRGYTTSHSQSTYVVHHFDFDPNARSYDSVEVDLFSRLFASVCYSFVYQRTLRSLVLTAAPPTWTAAHIRRYETRALTAAARNRRTHLSSLQSPPDP